jgi:hypothetical protein
MGIYHMHGMGHMGHTICMVWGTGGPCRAGVMQPAALLGGSMHVGLMSWNVVLARPHSAKCYVLEYLMVSMTRPVLWPTALHMLIQPSRPGSAYHFTHTRH